MPGFWELMAQPTFLGHLNKMWTCVSFFVRMKMVMRNHAVCWLVVSGEIGWRALQPIFGHSDCCTAPSPRPGEQIASSPPWICTFTVSSNLQAFLWWNLGKNQLDSIVLQTFTSFNFSHMSKQISKPPMRNFEKIWGCLTQCTDAIFSPQPKAQECFSCASTPL